MTVTIYVPRDSGSLSLGAEKVAQKLQAELTARHLDAKIVRNGSRGLYWLEPMVEVEMPSGRVAYGPVKPSDVASLLDTGMVEGRVHPLWLGLTDQLPFLAKQTRLTFARCGITDPLSLDDYRAHDGLKGLERALALTPLEIVTQVTESACAGAAAQAFPPASNGRPFSIRRASASTSSATPMKAIAAHLPIA